MKFEAIVMKCTKSEETGNHTVTIKAKNIEVSTKLGIRNVSRTYFMNSLRDPIEEDTKLELDLNDFTVTPRPLVIDGETQVNENGEPIILNWLS